MKLWECLCVDIQKYDCLVIKYGDIYLNQVLFEWSLPQSLLSWKDRPISLHHGWAMSSFLSLYFSGQFNKCKMVSHWLICISLVLAEFGHLFICLLACWIPCSINGLIMSLAHLMIVSSCLVDFHVLLFLNIRLLYTSRRKISWRWRIPSEGLCSERNNRLRMPTAPCAQSCAQLLSCVHKRMLKKLWLF